MDDYISREAALDAFAPFCKDCRFADDEKNCECCPHGYIRLKLIAIPAADVRPAVKGRWIETAPINEETMKPFFVNGPHLKCSNCGSIDFKRKFCPNCGADMRENENAEKEV